MKKYRHWLLIGALFFAQGVQALTLEQARKQGRVGETLDGYLAPVAHDAETLKLIDSINKAREESYQKLAAENNIAVDDVARLAGQKLVERAAPGEYVRGINGQWLKK